jgi:hypothetical protein
MILVRDMWECDFSVLLLSVTVQNSGTYMYRVCPPPGNPDIHESHTQLRVVERSDAFFIFQKKTVGFSKNLP